MGHNGTGHLWLRAQCLGRASVCSTCVAVCLGHTPSAVHQEVFATVSFFHNSAIGTKVADDLVPPPEGWLTGCPPPRGTRVLEQPECSKGNDELQQAKTRLRQESRCVSFFAVARFHVLNFFSAPQLKHHRIVINDELVYTLSRLLSFRTRLSGCFVTTKSSGSLCATLAWCVCFCSSGFVLRSSHTLPAPCLSGRVMSAYVAVFFFLAGLFCCFRRSIAREYRRVHHEENESTRCAIAVSRD